MVCILSLWSTGSGVTVCGVTDRPTAELADYDPSWVDAFEHVRTYVWPAVEKFALGMEHVGSTAVTGQAAKPIIDADVVVADSKAVSEAVVALASRGYLHEGDLGIPGREAFSPPDGSLSTTCTSSCTGRRPTATTWISATTCARIQTRPPIMRTRSAVSRTFCRPTGKPTSTAKPGWCGSCSRSPGRNK